MTDYKEYIYAIYQEKSFSKAGKKTICVPALAECHSEKGGAAAPDPPL